MFLYRAQFRRSNERIPIFVRKAAGDLNVQVNLVHHVCEWIAIYVLDDPYSICGNATLLAEAQYIYAGAGPD